MNGSNASAQRIRAVAVGAFGDAVVRQLCGMRRGVAASIASRPAEAVGGLCAGDVLVFAAWRQVPEFTEAIDERCFALRLPWVAIVQETPYLYVGPAIVPGCGACYRCFGQRLVQHVDDGEQVERRAAHYCGNAAAGVPGFLPATASFAAAAALDIVDKLTVAPNQAAGRVRRLNVLTWAMLQGRVIGLHGCGRCGQGRNEQTRSVDRLLKEMTDLKRAIQ
jgi:bacteriocin biosynthesis cyclodehydratase domain-containing protein